MEQPSFDRNKRQLYLKRSSELFERIDALRSRVSRGEYDDADLAELRSILRSLRFDLVGNDTVLSQAIGLSGSTIVHTYDGKSRPKYPNFMKMLHGAERLLGEIRAKPERNPPLGEIDDLHAQGEEVRIRPQRSSIFLNEADLKRVHDIARTSGATISSVIGRALDMYEAPTNRPGRRTRSKGTVEQVVIRNRVEIIRYSTAIITALDEALNYRLDRHHNLPPPALRIDDNSYLEEIRKLVLELRKLNEVLERPTKPQARTARARASGFGKHLDKFLSSYATALGKGAAGLTIGAAVGLLYQAGVGQEVIDAIWRHLRR